MAAPRLRSRVSGVASDVCDRAWEDNKATIQAAFQMVWTQRPGSANSGSVGSSERSQRCRFLKDPGQNELSVFIRAPEPGHPPARLIQRLQSGQFRFYRISTVYRVHFR